MWRCRYDLSLEEVRKFEEDVKQQLAVLAALSRNAEGGPSSGVQEDRRSSLDRGRPQGARKSSSDDASTPAAPSESDDDTVGEETPEHLSRVLMEALDDWRVYSGARLLPLQLSPQSIAVLSRLQRRILKDSKLEWTASVSLQPQKQQQQETDGGSFRPQGPMGAAGEAQLGVLSRRELPVRHGYLEKLGESFYGPPEFVATTSAAVANVAAATVLQLTVYGVSAGIFGTSCFAAPDSNTLTTPGMQGLSSPLVSWGPRYYCAYCCCSSACALL